MGSGVLMKSGDVCAELMGCSELMAEEAGALVGW